jgi:hypothetical protein
MAALWSSGEIDIADVPSAGWSPQAMRHFINSLDDNLSTERLNELDAALGLSDTSNAEIGRTWFIQVAQRQHRPAYEKLEQHLRRYGRTRLVRPVYVALAQNGSDFELAKELFADARGIYHPLTIISIETAFRRIQEARP